MIVDGAGSKLDAGETLAIGYQFDLANPGGTGTVSVRNGGAIESTDIHISSNDFLGGNGSVTGHIHNNGGTIAAGLSPGTLNIVGDTTQTAGNFEVEISRSNAEHAARATFSSPGNRFMNSCR